MSHSRAVSLAVVCVVFCGVLFLLPSAQAQYGASLQGVVTDPTGAVIPGAKITLTNKETNQTLTTESGAVGNYAFNALPPSRYKLEAELSGFKKKVVDDVPVRPEQANALNLQLEAGDVTETVNVNGSAEAAIDTATAQISGTVNQQQIATLPSFGRDVFQLVQLTPGVFGDASRSSGGGTFNLPGNDGPGGSGATNGIFQTENRPQASAGGARTDQNNLTLDGVSINSVTWTGAAVVTPTEDSVKELKVVSNNYDAEYGRTSGAQVQAISQNGTNDFHGSAFFKVDRPGLNSFARWDPNGTPGIKGNCKTSTGTGCVDDRNESRFNQFGGSVGGPVWKNKVFFFFAYETIRNHSSSSGSGWYETPAFDKLAPGNSIASKFLTIPGAGANFSSIVEGPGDPHQCADIGLTQGVNCNFIPGQGLDIGSPLKGTALGTHDSSFQNRNNPGVGGGLDGVPDIFFVNTVNPTTQVAQQFDGRLDLQATANDSVSYSIFWVPQNNTNYNGPVRASNLFHHNQINYAETALWNHIFSPSVLNELRVNGAGWRWNEFTSNPQTPYGLPSVQIASATNGTTVGTASIKNFGPSFGSIFDQNTYSVRDSLTKVVNSHNLKFGGEYTKLEYLDDPTWNAQPTYFFNNLWDFLNDAPTAENATVDPRTGIPSDFRKDTRTNLFAFFAKDDWKARSNLTLNFGLRWEYFGGLYEKKGNLSSLVLGSGANLLSGAHFRLGGNQVSPQKFNFGPQLGFAYSPGYSNGKLVLRGGFGIGYTGLEDALATDVRFNPPFVTNSGTLTGSQIAYGTAQNIFKFGQFPANPSLITPFDAGFLPTAPGVSLSVFGVPNNLPTQYTERYSLIVEQELGSQWVGSLGYQGSAGRHLPLKTNLNALFLPQVLAGQMAFNSRLNQINYYFDGGNSSYNALLTELRHRLAHTFEFDAQYRWSKSIDDGTAAQNYPYYIYGPAFLSRGASDFDVRNYFKLWGAWSPRFFGGNRNWLEKTVGGWTLSGVFNWHSGFPWTPVYNNLGGNAGVTNTGQGNLGPAAYLGGAGTSQSVDTFKLPNGNFPNAINGGRNVYFVAPVVVNATGSWPVTPVAVPGVPGIERNSFYGPQYKDVDASITKAFGLPNMPVLRENARLEFRANFYNLFNNLNLANPQVNITDAHFGRATTVLGARTVELEAHFRF